MRPQPNREKKIEQIKGEKKRKMKKNKEKEKRTVSKTYIFQFKLYRMYMQMM